MPVKVCVFLLPMHNRACSCESVTILHDCLPPTWTSRFPSNFQLNGWLRIKGFRGSSKCLEPCCKHACGDVFSPCICHFQTNKNALKIQTHVIFIAKNTQFQPKWGIKGLYFLYSSHGNSLCFSDKATYRKCISSLILILMNIFYLFFPKGWKNDLKQLVHDNRYFS